jgi:hypothetical protein
MQPEGAKVIDTFYNEPQKITIQEFDKILKGKRFDEKSNNGFFARLKALVTT